MDFICPEVNGIHIHGYIYIVILFKEKTEYLNFVLFLFSYIQISGVDKNSTADVSGLRNGDCVLEVSIFILCIERY